MGWILWGGVTPLILTQARRRRATPFVRLVSSQVKKTEKWSGLAVKRLTSYCVPSPEQTRPEPSAGATPVPRPAANRLPHCVTVWSAAGHAWSLMGQHAAGWFQRDTMRRCGVPRTGAPRRPNTDDSGSCPHAAETTHGFLETSTRLCTKWSNTGLLPRLSAHLLLRQSQEAFFYMQIYTGCLGSQKIFS